MTILGFDTATLATAVALSNGASVLVRYETPGPGERPAHASRVLELADELLAEAGIGWSELDRVAVGVGPGSFTGLRIGVATARALAQSLDIEIVAVGTLHALAAGATSAGDGPISAVLDARRREAFAAVYDGDLELLAPVATAPESLAATLAVSAPGGLAVGDGAIRFRDHLQAAGLVVAADDSPLHRVDAAAICRLADVAAPTARDAVVPCYVRRPDAEIARGSRNE